MLRFVYVRHGLRGCDRASLTFECPAYILRQAVLVRQSHLDRISTTLLHDLHGWVILVGPRSALLAANHVVPSNSLLIACAHSCLALRSNVYYGGIAGAFLDRMDSYCRWATGTTEGISFINNLAIATLFVYLITTGDTVVSCIWNIKQSRIREVRHRRLVVCVLVASAIWAWWLISLAGIGSNDTLLRSVRIRLFHLAFICENCATNHLKIVLHVNDIILKEQLSFIICSHRSRMLRWITLRFDTCLSLLGPQELLVSGLVLEATGINSDILKVIFK